MQNKKKRLYVYFGGEEKISCSECSQTASAHPFGGGRILEMRNLKK
jgi:hypothetical protein